MKKHGSETSLFQLIDRRGFNELVEKWEMDKSVRSFSTWEMTCALLTAASLGISSLREVEGTLGIARSTISDALSSRCHAFFIELCDVVLSQIKTQNSVGRKVKRALREIIAIDASTCFVHGSLFSHKTWVRAKLQGNKASLKLHAVYSVDGNWIENFLITGNKKGDSPTAHYLKIQANKIYVFDRAYNDLKFWLKILDHGSHIVTRLKDSKSNRKKHKLVLKNTPEEKIGVLYDGIYEASVPQRYRCAEELGDQQFRHIIYRDPETKRTFDFVTSDFSLSAQTVADIYKRRWAIELFFRWLKGHLNIRYLPLKTTNGVKIQVATALLLQLLLQLKRITKNIDFTPWEILRASRIAIVRQSLSQGFAPADCRWSRAVDPPSAVWQL